MKDKEKIQRIRNDLKALTGDFCRTRINEEYTGLCEKMIDKMSRKRYVPFLSGRKETWAAAIVYSIGQINFLFDSSFKPFIEGAEICSHFNVSRSTVTNKAKQIRDMFNMGYFDDEFSTERSIESNPMNNFVMLKNGLIVTKDQLKDIILDQAIARLKEEEDHPEDLEETLIPKEGPINISVENEVIKSDKKKDRKQRSILDF